MKMCQVHPQDIQDRVKMKVGKWHTCIGVKNEQRKERILLSRLLYLLLEIWSTPCYSQKRVQAHSQDSEEKTDNGDRGCMCLLVRLIVISMEKRGELRASSSSILPSVSCPDNRRLRRPTTAKVRGLHHLTAMAG